MSSPAGIDVLFGTAHAALGDAVARELNGVVLPRSLERTPDREILVRVDERARGRRVAIVQPLQAPGGEHLLELLLLADSCWRLGASGITAVIPYLGYARQDRRSRPGEALGARVLSGALGSAQLDRIVVVDPHNPAVEAGFSFPAELLTAVPLLAHAARRHIFDDGVIVAPDLGATKLAQRYAQLLNLPVAIVVKQRLGPSEVAAEHVVGNVSGRRPVIVDDMISTGGTIAAAADLLLARGAKPPVVVIATHGLFAPPAADRLRALPIAKVITTDSVPPPAETPPHHEAVPLAPLLADALRANLPAAAQP
ncbi:MAG TPA: ribose-phosphate diphosphokinase [Polyangiaceae bacterium]|nr:ribose-phosphate diphosphokinase [Polyangiaceae bacterium]